MNYQSILKQSFQIAKTKKSLWLYGLIVSAFARKGSSLNFNLPSDIPEEFFSLPESNLQTQSIMAAGQKAITALTDFLATIPSSTWLLLGSTIIIVSLIFFLVRLFISQWALGSLIGGINLALNRGQPTVRNASKLGLKAAFSLMALEIIPWFVYWSIAVLAIILATPIFTYAPKTVKLVVGLFLAVSAITYFTAGLILLIFTIILARRAVVIGSLRFKAAFKRSWRLAKTHWLSLIGQGLINFGLFILIALIWLSSLAALVVVALSLYKHSLNLLTPFILVAGLFFIPLSFWLSSVVKVFFESTWTIIYKKIS